MKTMDMSAVELPLRFGLPGSARPADTAKKRSKGYDKMHPKSKILLYWYAIDNCRLAIERGKGERLLKWQRRAHKYLQGGFRPMSDDDRISELDRLTRQAKEWMGEEGPDF